MECSSSSSQGFNNSEKPEIVGTHQPRDTEELKMCIKKAIKNNQMPVLHVGNAHKRWTEGIQGKAQILMVDCQTLKNMQESQPQAQLQHVQEDGLTSASTERETEQSIHDILNHLQKRIGKSPKLEIEMFENWGKTQKAKVISCYPTTKYEMQQVVKAASAENVKVRCAGTRHSWSPLFADNNSILINVVKMQSDYQDGSKIRISNRKRMEIDVMTGITTGDFKGFQLENKLNLPANVILEVVQMVSVVATACHGVGYDTKSPSDLIVKMRIFDSTGELKTYTTENQEMFKAVCANFGCFGVIFDMTIQLVPEIIVRREIIYYNLEDLFFNAENMKKLVEENWSVEVFWFVYNSLSLFDYEPRNDDVMVRAINKVTNKNVDLAGVTHYCWKNMKDSLSQEVLEAISPVIVANPSLTPYYAWSVFKTLKHVLYPSGHIYQQLPHAVHFRNYIHEAPVQDLEFAFDLKGDYNLLKKILQTVVKKVDHDEEKDEYPLNIALEMRSMGYSDAYLCPAILGNPKYGGSGHVLFIEVLSIAGTKGWKEFCIDVGTEFMKLGGVPHLAKEWEYLPGIEDHIHKKLGEHFKVFKEQLQKSGADPTGMFLNDKLKKFFRL